MMKNRYLFLAVGLVTLVLVVIVAPEQAFSQRDADGAQKGHYLPVVLGLMAGEQPTPDPTMTPGTTPTAEACQPVGGLLANPGFEDGTQPWVFFTAGSGEFAAVAAARECAKAAQLDLEDVSRNAQLFQTSFPLVAGQTYQLSFSAYSSSGNDLQVVIQQHGAPYARYGLDKVVDLTRRWETYNLTFTAVGFGGTTTDTRLRFWFPNLAQNGDRYWIDGVELTAVGGGATATPVAPTSTPPPAATNTPVPGATSTPVPLPTNTPPPAATNTPRPTNTPAPGGGQELLVFDLNRKVTEADRGFPYDQPPRANGDWTSPVNYAGGTLHYRIEVRSQPVAQNMRIQFCFWQEKNGDRFALENCGPQQNVRGTSGTVETWSVKVEDMWKLGGKPIEWWRPRYRNGMAIKNSAGLPVSNYNGWNWNGEDPKKWYPLDIKFKVVVVAEGATFSGWENYIDE